MIRETDVAKRFGFAVSRGPKSTEPRAAGEPTTVGLARNAWRMLVRSWVTTRVTETYTRPDGTTGTRLANVKRFRRTRTGLDTNLKHALRCVGIRKVRGKWRAA